MKSIDWVVARRQQLLLTQEEVACRAFISRAYYTNIECGRKIPSLRVVNQLAVALETTVDQIVTAFCQ